MINFVLMFLSALVFALAMFAASRLDAQEQDAVLDCLPREVSETIFTFGQGVGRVSPWEWEAYHDLTGEPIAVIDNEWNVPRDVVHVFTIRNNAPREGQWMIWVWWSPSTPGLTYWFVADHTIPDEPGVLHMCGAYQVESEIWR